MPIKKKINEVYYRRAGALAAIKLLADKMAKSKLTG